MEIKAPAKINLFLNVGSKRKDSFHELISVMVKVSLYDTLYAEESEEIHVEGPKWLPEEENLVYKASQMLRREAGIDNGCLLRMDKKIPAGHGLGGGSSDCAAALKLLNRFWKLHMSAEDLALIGGRLGSDVNFFLFPGDCVVTGRGEKVIPFDGLYTGRKVMIIVDTGIEISTKDIYEKYPGGRLATKEELNEIITYYKKGDWHKILRNDLEQTVYAMYPVLKDLKSRLQNWGAHPLLSGSGSCLFALVEDNSNVTDISKIIEENFDYRTWIVSNTVNGSLAEDN